MTQNQDHGLEQPEAKVQALRQALTDGEHSGTPAPFDRAAFFKRVCARPTRAKLENSSP
jgi:hypothetical protein